MIQKQSYVFSYFVLRPLPGECERRGRGGSRCCCISILLLQLAIIWLINLKSRCIYLLQHLGFSTKPKSIHEFNTTKSDSHLLPRITKNNAISSSCTFFQQIKKVSLDTILLSTFSTFLYTTAIKSLFFFFTLLFQSFLPPPPLNNWKSLVFFLLHRHLIT